jgi:hypothetical protein
MAVLNAIALTIIHGASKKDIGPQLIVKGKNTGP